MMQLPCSRQRRYSSYIFEAIMLIFVLWLFVIFFLIQRDYFDTNRDKLKGFNENEIQQLLDLGRLIKEKKMILDGLPLGNKWKLKLNAAGDARLIERHDTFSDELLPYQNNPKLHNNMQNDKHRLKSGQVFQDGRLREEKSKEINEKLIGLGTIQNDKRKVAETKLVFEADEQVVRQDKLLQKDDDLTIEVDEGNGKKSNDKEQQIVKPGKFEQKAGEDEKIEQQVETKHQQNATKNEANANKEEVMEGNKARNEEAKLEGNKNEKLVYDPNAPGEGGKGVIVDHLKLSPEEKTKFDEGYRRNAFNQYASDQISLHRKLDGVLEQECKAMKYHDNLPDASVIIIFHNEALSVLLRTMHSVLDNSPDHLIKEVFLVDDNSTYDHLWKQLDDYVAGVPKARVLRTGERVGLIKARLLGFSKVTAKVAIFLDSHCECAEGWLEPLLDRIAIDDKTVAIPATDSISADTFSYDTRHARDITRGGFDFDLYYNWRAVPKQENERREGNLLAPIRSPTMLGCCFAISAANFIRLGTYDPEFDIWGAENLEISFKAWMCGGKMEIIPCSHIGHVFRKWMPYKWRTDVDVLRKNNLRLAEVWMDDYKQFYHDRIYYNFVKFGNVTARKQLRESLKCHSFDWFVKNVYYDLYIPIDTKTTGPIKSHDKKYCVEASVFFHMFNQPVPAQECQYFKYNHQHWILSKENHIRRDEGCLSFDGKDRFIVKPCTDVVGKQMWDYTQNNTIVHQESGKCLTLSDNNAELFVLPCSGIDRQTWNWERRKLTLPGQQIEHEM